MLSRGYQADFALMQLKLSLIKVCKVAKLEQSESMAVLPIHIMKQVRELIISPLDCILIDNNFEAVKIAFSTACTKLVSSMILCYKSYCA